MDQSRFSIFAAVRDAYLFVGREWRILLRAGLLPMGLQAATTLFVEFNRPDASGFEACLWSLPSTLFFAWFMFAETRLILLGERLDRLPADPAFVRSRRRAMTAAVLLATLFNMGFVLVTNVLSLLAQQNQAAPNLAISFCEFFLLGAAFWAVRFAILPLLAAVHYPLAPVLRKVSGLLFSLRLVGLALVCILPVELVAMVLLEIGNVNLTLATGLTPEKKVAFLLLLAPISLLSAALINAAGVFALRQILGREK